MIKLTHASIGIRKAAALQGIRTGEFEPVFHSDNCSDGSDLVAIVQNQRKQIKIDYDDIRAAVCLSWSEIF